MQSQKTAYFKTKKFVLCLSLLLNTIGCNKEQVFIGDPEPNKPEIPILAIGTAEVNGNTGKACVIDVGTRRYIIGGVISGAKIKTGEQITFKSQNITGKGRIRAIDSVWISRPEELIGNGEMSIAPRNPLKGQRVWLTIWNNTQWTLVQGRVIQDGKKITIAVEQESNTGYNEGAPILDQNGDITAIQTSWEKTTDKNQVTAVGINTIIAQIYQEIEQ